MTAPCPQLRMNQFMRITHKSDQNIRENDENNHSKAAKDEKVDPVRLLHFFDKISKHEYAEVLGQHDPVLPHFGRASRHHDHLEVEEILHREHGHSDEDDRRDDSLSRCC